MLTIRSHFLLAQSLMTFLLHTVKLAGSIPHLRGLYKLLQMATETGFLRETRFLT